MKIGIAASPSRSGDASASRSDILVEPEEVGRIVVLLCRRESIVIRAVSGLDARFALIIHHEVRVGAGKIVRMDRSPIGLRPFLQNRGIGRIGIDTRDRRRPNRVAVGP